MENRQERLEAKVKNLQTSAKFLRIMGGVFTGVGIIALVVMGGIVIIGLYMDQAGFQSLDSNVVMRGLEALAMGWILHSVGNAFEAIVDIIGELSETV